MGIVTVHLNAHAVPSTVQGPIVVQGAADYIACRQAIEDAIAQTADRELWVRPGPWSQWFWDLEGVPGVRVCDEDPRRALASMLRTAVMPDDITARDIVGLGLLELSPPAQPVVDVWHWIVGKKLGEVWWAQDPSWPHFRKLMSWCVATPRSVDGLHATLASCCGRILEQWTARAQGALQNAYQSARKDPWALARSLAARAVLRTYPERVAAQWCREERCHHRAVSWLVEHVRDLPLPPDLQSRFSEKALAYWNRELADKAQADLVASLASMSGRLDGELRAIERHLRQHGELCSVDVLEQVRLKFRDIESANQTVDTLRTMLPPSMPAMPRSEWQSQDWLKWAVQEYLPARNWILEHKRGDLLAQCDSSAFEEWLWRAYPELLHAPDVLVNTTHASIERLLREDCRVLWLMVDGLSTAWLDIAVDEFARHGLLAQGDVAYRIALLPSDTSVSRHSALLGTLPREATGNLGEEFAQQWHSRGPYDARLVRSVDDAEVTFAEGCRLCCTIWSALDHACHEPDSSVPDRKDDIRTRLRPLCRVAAEVAHQFRGAQQLLVVVTSDHGATRIICDDHRLELPPHAIAGDDRLELHRRFVRLSSLESIDAVRWFPLEAAAFALDSPYAVARGQGYVDRVPMGYTHGGLTPEEVVVPILQLAPEAVPKQELSVSHTSYAILRGRVERITLTVRNPYGYPLERMELVLPGTGFLATQASVPPDTEVRLDGEVVLEPKARTEESAVPCDYVISYHLVGTRQRQTGVVPVSIRLPYRPTEDIMEELET